VFAGQNVSVTQVTERIWLVTFMQYDLDYFDEKWSGRLDSNQRLPAPKPGSRHAPATNTMPITGGLGISSKMHGTKGPSAPCSKDGQT
jgi:hypothetical protein